MKNRKIGHHELRSLAPSFFQFSIFNFQFALHDGDIIFHESRSAQSRAIQLATKSRYSHMGILYRDGDRWFVYEAVQPVKLTPLDEWIRRGKDGHFVVKRLRDPLAPATLRRMKATGHPPFSFGHSIISR